MTHASLFAKEEEGAVSTDAVENWRNRSEVIESRKVTGTGTGTERYWRNSAGK